MNIIKRIFRTLVVRPITRWVCRSVGMCGVGSPPDAESHSEHGSRELVKLVHSRFAPQPLADLSPRWKVLCDLRKWKHRQLLIMLFTIFRVRGLEVWELELVLEILKIRKTSDLELFALHGIMNKWLPFRGETLSRYRERLRSFSEEAYWFLGSYCNGPGSPLRSSHPGRVAALSKSYAYLCRWLTDCRPPATRFRTVEKRRKRGYTDHGSLGSRSYATKQLDVELAQIHYDNWPPWRKIGSLCGPQEFLEWCFSNGSI